MRHSALFDSKFPARDAPVEARQRPHSQAMLAHHGRMAVSRYLPVGRFVQIARGILVVAALCPSLAAAAAWRAPVLFDDFHAINEPVIPFEAGGWLFAT